jgi:Protein of unknown function (DUF3426)
VLTAALLRTTRAQLQCVRCGEPYDALSHLVDEEPPEATSTHARDDVAIIAARLAREAQLDLDQPEALSTPSSEKLSAIRATASAATAPSDRFDVALESIPQTLPSMLTTARWPAPSKTVRQSSRRIRWLVSLALSLFLLMQIVHHYRVSLATAPVIGAGLLSVYHSIGVPLEARFDPASYEIQKIERVDADTPGTLRLHARIINHGIHAQPAPLLRVTLQDGHGQPLGRRDFSPHEYSIDQHIGSSFMETDDRLEAKLLILDPGSAAVSFSLEACLTYQGKLLCSTEARSEISP